METLIATTNSETQEIALRLVKRPNQPRIMTGVNTEYELVLELRRAYRRAVVLGVVFVVSLVGLTLWALTRNQGPVAAPQTLESFR